MMEQKNQSNLTIYKLEMNWEAIKSMGLRDKLKALKSLGFDIKAMYKSGETALEEM